MITEQQKVIIFLKHDRNSMALVDELTEMLGDRDAAYDWMSENTRHWNGDQEINIRWMCHRMARVIGQKK